MFQVKEFEKRNSTSSNYLPKFEDDVNNFLENHADKIKNVIDIKYIHTEYEKYNYIKAVLIYETK